MPLKKDGSSPGARRSCISFKRRGGLHYYVIEPELWLVPGTLILRALIVYYSLYCMYIHNIYRHGNNKIYPMEHLVGCIISTQGPG